MWCSDVTGNGYCHTHIAGDGTLCGNKKVLINPSTLYEKEKFVRKNWRDQTCNQKSSGTNHITCRRGYGFLFHWEHFVRTTRELEYLCSLSQIFFPQFNIRLYDKNSESDFFFFSTKIRIFCSATLGIRIFFLEKNHNPPPWKLNDRSLIQRRTNNTIAKGIMRNKQTMDTKILKIEQRESH